MADPVDRRAVLHIIGNAFDDSVDFKSADYVRIRRQVEALPTMGRRTPCRKKLLRNTKGDRMDDLISRQDAIQTAERMFKRCDTGSMEDYHDLLIEALTALPSAQPECEDDTKSHSEKDILNGCISLLEEMVCHFKDYMEWIGYEPNEEEKEYRYFGMTYFHIVQRLFLWHTRHAGGTSTRKKCYELGIDEPSDGVRFPLWDDYDGEQDD